jgi:hypothetical protein
VAVQLAEARRKMSPLILVAAQVFVSAIAPCPSDTRPLSDADLRRQALDVTQALQPLVIDMEVREAKLEATQAGAARDAEFDRIVTEHRAAEDGVLSPLAKNGNAEAMYRLAELLRDSSSEADIRRWFSLESEAARLGHPGAADEMVRWYWHQRRDGLIAEVQRNREIAFSFAQEGADRGSFHGMVRIAVYISGEFHQYPGDTALGRRVLELCARTDDRDCQENLVSKQPYDYRLSPSERHHWLSRLVHRSPALFSERLTQAEAAMTPAQLAEARASEAAWRPNSWVSLRPEWNDLKRQILVRGATSIGKDTVCATQTPWCRGVALAR